jgi:hypothetical protein
MKFPVKMNVLRNKSFLSSTKTRIEIKEVDGSPSVLVYVKEILVGVVSATIEHQGWGDNGILTHVKLERKL